MAAKSISSSIAPGKSFPPQTTHPVTLSENGRVSSVALAEHFGIAHGHVMRDIRAVLGKVPPEWHQSNFGSMFREVEVGQGAVRQDPYYLLTRDAFTLLAMGYNSPRAIAWKLRYIAAFNALEQAVAERLRQSSLEDGARLAYALSPSKKRRMGQVVHWRKKGLGVASIAKLLDVNGREVSFLLKAAVALGRLPIEGGAHAAVQR